MNLRRQPGVGSADDKIFSSEINNIREYLWSQKGLLCFSQAFGKLIWLTRLFFGKSCLSLLFC